MDTGIVQWADIWYTRNVLGEGKYTWTQGEYRDKCYWKARYLVHQKCFRGAKVHRDTRIVQG